MGQVEGGGGRMCRNRCGETSSGVTWAASQEGYLLVEPLSTSWPQPAWGSGLGSQIEPAELPQFA